MRNVSRVCAALSVAFTITACGGGGNTGVTPTLTHTAASNGDASTTSVGARRVIASASVVAEMPRSSLAFVDSIGVVTHFHYQDTPYVTSYSAVRDLLIGLGIHHIRECVTVDTYQPYRNAVSELAAAGIHTQGVALLNEPPAEIATFVSQFPNVLESVEGPNERDLSGVQTWAADLLAYQKVLYAGIKSQPLTASLPVIGPSLTSYQAYTQTFPQGSFSQLADSGNIHDYFGTFNPGTLGTGANFPPYGYYGSIAFWQAVAGYLSGPRPIEATETGWGDGASTETVGVTVSSAIKARYIMRVLLEHWNSGITRTFLYELLDEGGQSFSNYGLLTSSLTPKPAYRALKNLVTQLGGGTPTTLAPLAYTLSVASGDTTVHHSLLQRGTGKYNLLLWNEVRATDPVAPTPEVVTLTLPAGYSTIRQIQWQDDGTTTSTVLTPSATNSVSFNVTDRVSDIYIKP